MAGFVERKRWLFFALPFTFTKYTVTEEKLVVNSGIFRTQENTCYLYKIIDIKLEKSLMERIFGMGTIICYTGDVTDKVIKLIHIKHCKEVNDFLLDQSEEMRRKRRTLNTQSLTQNMDGIDEEDIDG
ncbi:MAG: PH domain-containing protein [Lachnospiraceae bacterium]|nr:PH domain-containing protein [Lachnospiraceae bacterium]